MAVRNYCCFKGRGSIGLVEWAARIARTAGFVEVGNAYPLTINATENTEDVPDMTDRAGGSSCVVREIQAVQVAMSLRCHSLKNLSMATLGKETAVAEATVAARPLVVWPGTVEPLGLLDEDVAVVVTSAEETPATTYVLGRDYEVLPAGGLRILPKGTIPAPTIASGTATANVKVTYTQRAHTSIQLYIAPNRPVSMYVDGFNVAAGDGDGATAFELYKVQFGPATNLQLISEQIAIMEFTGTALRDTTKPRGTTANPFSQYGTLRI